MHESKIIELGFLGMDHAAVASENVEKLCDWYCEVLGYERLFRHEKPVWILRAPDGTLLEIMPKDETGRHARTTWTPGWSHLALRVKDLDAAILHLDRYHIVWGGTVGSAIGGGRVRNFYDPEGNMLQILERASIDLII